MRPTRKRIRLDPVAYLEGGRAFSITIGTSSRLPVFRDSEFGLECISILERLSERHTTKVYAYCLMPDHVHLLLSTPQGVLINRFVGSFTSRCFAARRGRGNSNPFWQRSFYDHGLRKPDDLRAVANYILNNPVREGLVARWRDYPLCGSLEFEI